MNCYVIPRWGEFGVFDTATPSAHIRFIDIFVVQRMANEWTTARTIGEQERKSARVIARVIEFHQISQLEWNYIYIVINGQYWARQWQCSWCSILCEQMKWMDDSEKISSFDVAAKWASVKRSEPIALPESKLLVNWMNIMRKKNGRENLVNYYTTHIEFFWRSGAQNITKWLETYTILNVS